MGRKKFHCVREFFVAGDNRATLAFHLSIGGANQPGTSEMKGAHKRDVANCLLCSILRCKPLRVWYRSFKESAIDPWREIAVLETELKVFNRCCL